MARTVRIARSPFGPLMLAGLLALPLLTGAPLGALADSEILNQIDKDRLTDFVQQDCGSCHGITLEGGLGGPLLPDNLEHYDLDVIQEIILGGLPGTAMPRWRGLLNEEEAAFIAEGLKTGAFK
ncbi:cytochrome c [Pseudovibrio sp. Tun.PSC04-5.I4]|uniref:c-type cytochrome n=1 Tax=Pseudovibrio sp. Tun.PSC04-5.I4 TaxID=1798213 RepID=UPI00088A4595|nr:cytochrome c [Pseudovibrio sp. Tun.PSC04-5.I4]SDR48515.1 cytochrome c55X [Pseudovibrio sp. Tun.PSC04-5.I4]